MTRTCTGTHRKMGLQAGAAAGTANAAAAHASRGQVLTASRRAAPCASWWTASTRRRPRTQAGSSSPTAPEKRTTGAGPAGRLGAESWLLPARGALCPRGCQLRPAAVESRLVALAGLRTAAVPQSGTGETCWCWPQWTLARAAGSCEAAVGLTCLASCRVHLPGRGVLHPASGCLVNLYAA